jgi:intracellular multiplication protein IcmK
MFKVRIKKIAIAVMLIMLSGSQQVFAQDAQAEGQSAPMAMASTTTTLAANDSSASNPPTNAADAAGAAIAADTAQFQQTAQQAQGSQPTAQSAQTQQSEDRLPFADRIKPRYKHSHYHNYSSAGTGTIIEQPLSYHESQQTMLNSAPKVNGIATSPEAETAFNALMQQNMPLTPQQVVRLRQLIDASQRAASIPATVPPKPVSTTLMINLAPGTTPPAIRLAQGYVTSLVFVDSTGAPWPVAAYDIGDPKTANIQWDGKSNVMLIQATSPYGDSDLVIRLTGLMTPLTLELVSGQRVVDYRTDIHVSGLGPNSKDLPTGTPLPNSANQLLLGVLDGIAPPASKTLTVKGGDCQAWLMGERMYLRTRLTVLSPGWVGRMVSPDGMYAYEIQKSSSVLVSQYGEPIELKIEGF